MSAIATMAMDSLRTAVRQNGKVNIRNFGTFKIVKKKARSQRLPSGKVIQVPARSIVKFIPSKNFLKPANYELLRQ
jgi:nucleoid DNA-binding protein